MSDVRMEPVRIFQTEYVTEFAMNWEVICLIFDKFNTVFIAYVVNLLLIIHDEESLLDNFIGLVALNVLAICLEDHNCRARKLEDLGLVDNT